MSRTADPSDIPERLAKAGLELFLSQGYNATGIQQITKQAGVPKGSFYNHFASKEVFAATIVDRYAEQSKTSWQLMMKDAPDEAMASIHHVFGKMFEYHERNTRPLGCLVGNFAAEIASSSELCRERLICAQHAWRERLAELILRAQESGEVRLDINAMDLSATTWSLWEGALLRMKIEGSIAPLRESLLMLLNQFYPAD